MTKHPSAQKRHRQSVKRETRNHAIRSRVRTFVRRVRESIAAGKADEASDLLRVASRALDKAVTKGVIHRNTAARKKSALARRLATA